MQNISHINPFPLLPGPPLPLLTHLHVSLFFIEKTYQMRFYLFMFICEVFTV